MDFSFKSYIELIENIGAAGYQFLTFDDFAADGGAIIRHDIDYSLDKAVKMAEIENSIRTVKVKSTYFLMLSSDFYNLFSVEGKIAIDHILASGFEIGLHFDEQRYDSFDGSDPKIIEHILDEAEILSRLTGQNVTKISMHRPSKKLLQTDLQIPGMINTYSHTFFKDFKYVSDSRRRWREPISEIIERRIYSKIQILVHPFWYNDVNLELEDSVKTFVNNANRERYRLLGNNFTNLSDVMEERDVT